MSRSRAWTWRQAITESDLKPTTRHVLLTLSLYMNDVGGGCYPTTKTLSEATGLSERAVCEHLAIAKDAGWVKVSEHGFRGRRWKSHEYRAAWPPSHQGTDAGSVPHGSRGTDAGSVPNDGALTQDPRGTDPHDNEALILRQSNTPINNPRNSPGEGSPHAPVREASTAWAGEERGKGKLLPEPRRNDIAEIGKLITGQDGQEYISIVVMDHWDLVYASLTEWQRQEGGAKESMIGNRTVSIPKRIVERVLVTKAIRGVA